VTDDKYLVSAKISIGAFFGVPDDDAFIELREPITKDTLKLQKAAQTNDIETIIDTFVETFPRLLVEHNLMKDDEKKLESAEVIDTLSKKLELFMHVFTEYSERVLFTLGKKVAAK
jgi:hypothetical protein